ncbi:MAG: exonuclease SbcCD subunit D [Candidatus Melainabacteria bacterium]|nr:exonuclease SbcCD subunit D [Candidatus Melainabacteria bacterium]
MTIEVVHVSDIHFGSGENHGRINPQTGLNIRFEDFVAALKKTVDYTIEKGVDVFLFSGDAYRNASPEPIYLKMFARELNRLSKHDIKTILVVGNHDQLLRSTQSHAMSVFQSLEVSGMLIVDKPMSVEIETKKGSFQLIGLPHITRHNLASLEKYKDATAQDIDRLLAEHVQSLLRGYYAKLDLNKPCLLTAHMSTDSALAGIEEELLVGYTMTFPTDMFVYEGIDYVALGHIHKYQVLRKQDPAIVYAGSLERVDFGEEKEDKGFVHVKLERGRTSFEFHSIDPRPFITVEVDLVKEAAKSQSVKTEADPEDSGRRDALTDILIDALRKKILPGCVLRLRYRVSQEDLQQINEDRVREACAEALSFKIQTEVVADHGRSRIPQLTEASVLSPLKALETYLTEVAPDKMERLLLRTQDMMSKLSDSKKAE